MKIIFLLLMLGINTAFSETYSQKTLLTIDVESQSIQDIFDIIEKKSEYVFLFTDDINHDIGKKVNVNSKSATLNKILDGLFEGTDLTYRIANRQVTITKTSSGKTIKNNDIGQQTRSVSGQVKDINGEPLIGVSVSIKGGQTGTVTDLDGKFSLNVEPNAVIEFSYIGYRKTSIQFKNQASLNITMEEDTQSLEEVIVVGYGTQKKATLTGAISQINSDDIVVTKNENVQNMLTGKVPGVRNLQKTAEPGAYDNSFDIRGMGTPLVVIDGVPRDMGEFQRMSPNDIENISVLKDASAAIYGVRSANGVVLVTTKKGSKGSKPKISYDGSYSFTFPSGMPKIVDAVDYITLINEGSMRSQTDPKWTYDQAFLDQYLNGEKESYDWYDYMFKGYAPQTQHNLSVSGGTERTSYYFGAGYFSQNSFFSTDDRNYSKWNIKASLSSQITKDLTFDLTVSTTLDERNQPNQSAVWTIRDYWRMNPLVGPYADPGETMYNHAVTDGENPLAFLNSDLIGYQKSKKDWFDGQASLKYNLPWIQGMSLKGMFSYNYYVGDNTTYKKQYTQYIYNETEDLYTPYNVSSPSRITRAYYPRKQMLWNFVLDYARTFGRHNVKALALWESQIRRGDNFSAQRDLAFALDYLLGGKSENQQGTMLTGSNDLYDNANNAVAGQVNYAFADKYLLEFLFRYDGSSKWMKGNQWGFFPGASAGWRISEEEFFKSSPLSFIQQLKLRVSYGSTGDDGAAAYQWLSGWNYPTSGRDWFNIDPRNAEVSKNGREFSGGYVLGGNYLNSIDSKGIPNQQITWYKSNIFNAGIDFEAWNGLFGFTFEYFNRNRTGLLAKRTGGIPTVVGAMLPDENLNSDRNYGLELLLTHRNKVNNDLSYKVSLMGSITRQEKQDVESPAYGNSWDYWQKSQQDRLQGIYWGFESIGQYQSWEEIYNDPTYTGKGTLPGDYKYLDWNGDGEINDNDKHPIRFDDSPWVQFSASLGASYKRFDIDVLFQGATMGSLEYGEQMRGDSRTLDMFMDRWHPEDPHADPYDPATKWVKGKYSYAGGARRDNATYNVQDLTYFRLKNIELGYNLPVFNDCSFRFYISGYNVFTITKVDNVDPEHPGLESSWGFMYPLDKKLTFGLILNY